MTDEAVALLYRGRTRKPHRHATPVRETLEADGTVTRTYACGHPYIEERARRGRQSRNYGNRAELDAARRYGGVKVGHGGGPSDIRSSQWLTQMKTHRRLPPAEWRAVFANLAASTDRPHRLLLRFVIGPGQAPVDYFVVEGTTWLDWFGRDDEEAV